MIYRRTSYSRWTQPSWACLAGRYEPGWFYFLRPWRVCWHRRIKGHPFCPGHERQAAASSGGDPCP